MSSLQRGPDKRGRDAILLVCSRIWLHENLTKSVASSDQQSRDYTANCKHISQKLMLRPGALQHINKEQWLHSQHFEATRLVYLKTKLLSRKYSILQAAAWFWGENKIQSARNIKRAPENHKVICTLHAATLATQDTRHTAHYGGVESVMHVQRYNAARKSASSMTYGVCDSDRLLRGQTSKRINHCT
jgi:hypothetical protein